MGQRPSARSAEAPRVIQDICACGWPSPCSSVITLGAGARAVSVARAHCCRRGTAVCARAGTVAAVDEPFVINLADAPASGHPARASFIQLEPDGVVWPDTGVNVHVMQPGQPSCRYHSEPVQEDFLVLSGRCVAIVDGGERPLRQWDFFHCPAGTDHVFVGVGDGPCAVLMIGSRREGACHYPVSDVVLDMARLLWRRPMTRHTRTPTGSPRPLTPRSRIRGRSDDLRSTCASGAEPELVLRRRGPIARRAGRAARRCTGGGRRAHGA